MSALAMMTSLALQHGVPVETIARKFAYMQFAPNGPTGNRQIPFARSLVDYIGRWIASEFGDAQVQAELGVRSAEAANPPPDAVSLLSQAPDATSGELCADCGGTLRRAGTCMACSSWDGQADAARRGDPCPHHRLQLCRRALARRGRLGLPTRPSQRVAANGQAARHRRATLYALFGSKAHDRCGRKLIAAAQCEEAAS